MIPVASGQVRLGARLSLGPKACHCHSGSHALLPNHGGEHPPAAACHAPAAPFHQVQEGRGERCHPAAVPSPQAPKREPKPRPKARRRLAHPPLRVGQPPPCSFVPPVAIAMGARRSAPDAAPNNWAGRRLPSSIGEPARLRELPEAPRRRDWPTGQFIRHRPPRRSLEGPTRPTEPQPLDPLPPLRVRVPRAAPLEPPRDPRPPRRPGAMASWPKRARQSSWPKLGGRKSVWNKAARS